MIVAVNANAAVDQVMFIDRFAPGTTMRPARTVMSVGGKALDSAVVLRALGAPLRAISFVAGRNGQTLADLLAERQIETDLIWLPGETRFSNVIVETDFNRHSHITTPGYTVTLADCALFKERLLKLAEGAGWAVLAGSLPGGAPAAFYADLTALLNGRGVKVLVDCFGQPARHAAAAGGRLAPEVLKMNQREFTLTFGDQPRGQPEWIAAVRAVMDRCGLRSFILTCGQEGLLAFTPEGIYHASAPQMQAVNAAGSGDAVSAAVAYRRWLGDGWEETLRWAAATGAAVTLTEGTAECRMSDVQRILPETAARRLA